jgi:endonuclease YncB( thermonuclease family)
VPLPPRKVEDRGAPDRTPPTTILKGKCYVVDGDTITISGTSIRIAGIDAPELDHPWGKKAKSAMIELCKGKVVTAVIQPGLSYDRTVAKCYLEDGTDLAAEMVKQGFALDWPKFSGGGRRASAAKFLLEAGGFGPDLTFVTAAAKAAGRGDRPAIPGVARGDTLACALQPSPLC